MRVDVKPTELYPTLEYINLDVGQLVIGSLVTLRICYINNNGHQLDIQMVDLSGSDYDAWGDDDNYITETVLSKLELTARG